MIIKLVSTSNGFYDFDVTDAGTIRRVTVSENIKYGDLFNIYYGDGYYTPHQKEGGKWLGKKGIGGYLTGDLEKSIRKSRVFLGEASNSDGFYDAVAKKFCDCKCSDPFVKSQSQRQVLAFDLDFPDYGRESSRLLIYLSECGKCGNNLTHGSSVGSFHTTGIDVLKSLADKEAKETINWSSVITSIKAAKEA